MCSCLFTAYLCGMNLIFELRGGNFSMANQPKKYKKFVATAATATLVASAIAPAALAAEFKDVTGNDHEVAINALAEQGIIKGFTDGTFKPNQTVTRGQVVKLLGRWLETLGEEVPADWKTEKRFTDVATSNQDEELVKYAALTKDAGVFAGSGGNLNAAQTMTRQQMALVLVRAIKEIGGVDLVAEYKENGHVTEMSDLDKAHGAEQRNAIVALEYAGITKVSVFNPNNSITRGQFASFLYRTISVLDATVLDATVKAINNTTVEVTFEDAVEDIKALDFTIEGLEIKNAAVKQTNNKVVVLTTASQEADKEYTVSLNDEKIGSFKGIAAVIPTKIDVTTSSVQGIIGKEVTLKAQVTVADGQSKANIPVTFNIVSDNANVNSKIEVEATTDENGVATYSYTRYYEHNDNVAAYATEKSTVASQGKVYWANKTQLAVSEITTGNELANNAKKSYKVVGEKNTTYYIAIKENLNVSPDKITKVSVQDHNNANNFVTPYELTTGTDQYAKVQTNSSGEATFTIFGNDLSATPIVYLPSSVNKSVTDYSYSKLALQTEAPTVKFSQLDKLAISVVAEGTADSAEYVNTPVAYDQNSVGGRTYTVTVTDKDGKLAPEGTTAYVTFEEGNIYGDVYFSTAKDNFSTVVKGDVKPITVGKEGKAQFRVAGKGATSFVKPTVFLNTAGKTSPVELDKTDVQKVTDVTYFKSAVVANATLKVTDVYGRTVSSLEANKDAYFTYQSVDQNGFDYRPTGYTTGNGTQTIWKPVQQPDGSFIFVQEVVSTGTTVHEYVLAFDVTSTFGNATVKDAAGTVLNASQNLGNTKTYQVKSDATGKAIVRVTSQNADTVSVNVTGASNILPTQTASVSFTSSASVPALYNGVVESFNSTKQTLKFVGKNEISYVGDKVFYRNSITNQPIITADEFAAILENATGTVKVTYELKDGVTTFYITSIATSGSAPNDTATTPTIAYTNINGTVGTAITAVVPTVTGVLPGSTLTYTASANLPTGLVINPTTGVITGTPTVVASTTVTVTGTYTNSIGTVTTLTAPVAINVVGVPAAKPNLTGGAGKATGGVAGTVYQVSTDGTTWTDVTASATGELTLAAGTYSVKVKATATAAESAVQSGVVVAAS